MRPLLTQDDIVEAAIRIVDTEGLPSLTMRHLGAELGVEAMSLYYHFPNKAAVLEAARVKLYQGISGSEDPGAPWQTEIRAVMFSTYRLARAHPSFVVLAFSSSQANTSITRGAIDRQTLRRAGFTEADADRALTALVAYLFGFLREATVIGSRKDRTLKELEATFAFGLDALIAGIEARASTAPARTSRSRRSARVTETVPG